MRGRYPINALRNVAVREAKTELLMVIDVDFIPSTNFWEFCTDPALYHTLVSRYPLHASVALC